METIIKIEVPEEALSSYLNGFVGNIFKILPLWEQHEPTLNKYLTSLQVELTGCYRFYPDLATNSDFPTLLNILEWLKSKEASEKSAVKREIFKAISICKKIASKYKGGDEC